MKILLIGANGQLGGDVLSALQRSARHTVVALTHAEIEVTDDASVRQALAVHNPEVVINTAAYHKVDEVELNPEKAFAVNALAPWRLAVACHEHEAALMLISTDYVFGGAQSRRTPYTEVDVPEPINVYGISKLAGEHFVRSNWERHYVVRTSGLYGVRGASGKGGNFVELMLRLAKDGKEIRVVDDQRLTPTYTVDLAQQLIALIDSEQYGLYHVTNEGDCTWYEFAAKIFELEGIQPTLSPTTSLAFKTQAARPAYSVMAKAKLAAIGLPAMRHWHEALADYLRVPNKAPAAAHT